MKRKSAETRGQKIIKKIIKRTVTSSIVFALYSGKDRIINTFQSTNWKDVKYVELLKGIGEDMRENLQNFFQGDIQKDQQGLMQEYLEKYGVKIYRDGPIFFYEVEEGDIKNEQTKQNIHKKITAIPKFKDYNIPAPTQGYNTKGRNISNSSIITGMQLIIPLPKEQREISLNQFLKQAESAVNEMLNNSIYGQKIRKIINEIQTQENISQEEAIKYMSKIMAVYARCESAEQYDLKKGISDQIGACQLYRYEPSKKAYSVTRFHIGLWGAGKNAQNNLNFSIGECLYPKNACKLFLAYCCESLPGNPSKFFTLNSDSNIQEAAKSYNGKNYKKNDYDTKLKNNKTFIFNQ